MKKALLTIIAILTAMSTIFTITVVANIQEDRIVTWVNLHRRDITDERLAEMISNGEIPQSVTNLNLSNNQISDISPLSHLTNLEVLIISYNQISDISSLSNLTNLYDLSLRDNQITDISALSGMVNLGNAPLTGGLSLDNNQISDLTPLQNLTHLQTLSLQNNLITDITPLQNLTNLWWLDLRDNQIEDVMPLVWLTGLDSQGLVLRGNPVANDTEQLAELLAARSRNAHRTTLTLGHVLGTEPYTVNDALEILRYTVGLPSVLDNCTVAVIAALIVNEEVPDVRDALQILRSLVGLSSAFDEGG